MKKKLVAGAGVAVIGLTSIAGLGVASAATSSTNGDIPIVDKIAQKFHLNRDEVKAVFEADRTEHHAEMEAKQKERLTQAVQNGKLTQAQADSITAKHDEMKTFMDSLKDKTPEERKAAMDAKKVELTKWATDNNISESFMRGPGGRGHGPDGNHRMPGIQRNVENNQ